jgi:hypothetical protein
MAQIKETYSVTRHEILSVVKMPITVYTLKMEATCSSEVLITPITLHGVLTQKPLTKIVTSTADMKRQD